jgi:hypothetical protein
MDLPAKTVGLVVEVTVLGLWVLVPTAKEIQEAQV